MKIIKVQSKPYVLKLGINALCRFEDMTGKTVEQIEDEFSIKTLRILFYCALKGGGNKEIDLEATGELMDDFIAEEGMDALSDILGEVAEASLGKQEARAELESVLR